MSQLLPDNYLNNTDNHDIVKVMTDSIERREKLLDHSVNNINSTKLILFQNGNMS